MAICINLNYMYKHEMTV